MKADKAIHVEVVVVVIVVSVFVPSELFLFYDYILHIFHFKGIQMKEKSGLVKANSRCSRHWLAGWLADHHHADSSRIYLLTFKSQHNVASLNYMSQAELLSAMKRALMLNCMSQASRCIYEL